MMSAILVSLSTPTANCEPPVRDAAPVRLLRVAALVPAPLAASVQRAMAGFHVRLEFSRDLRLFVNLIESGPPDVIVVDADLADSRGDLIRFARSLKPAIRVVGVLYYWSDREPGLREQADALVHKPPRIEEWHASLRRLALPERLPTRAPAP
jgi:DNA-binding response OmpR family regulator